MHFFASLKPYIETHFGAVLLAGCALGLVMPGMPQLPNETAVLVLALLMFISCYKLGEGGFKTLAWRRVCVFWALRYAVLPWAMWAVARLTVPQYALGVFLLSVLPAGVSSPAIAHIYGGAVAPGLAVVVLSQLATPFAIPLQFAGLSHLDAGAQLHAMPSPVQLFYTMVWCIFVPMGVYACLRKRQKLAAYMEAQGKMWSMLLVAFVIALAIAKQRDILVSRLDDMALSLIITLLCFLGYIAFGWWCVFRAQRAERTTYAACSAFNNAALGVSLALLHFPPDVVLFVAVSEIAWALLPVLFGGFLRKFG